MAIKAIEFLRPDYCNKCKTNKSIECYDVFGRPINYTLLIDYMHAGRNIGDMLDKRELTHMTCKKCGMEYNLDWSKFRSYPVPLVDNLQVMLFLRVI